MKVSNRQIVTARFFQSDFHIVTNARESMYVMNKVRKNALTRLNTSVQGAKKHSNTVFEVKAGLRLERL